MAIIGEIKRESQIRFWNKVCKTETCWIWTASQTSAGYGVFGIKRKTDKAHRIAWRLIKGEIPKNVRIFHSCTNILCVNPDHLFSKVITLSNPLLKNSDGSYQH